MANNFFDQFDDAGGTPVPAESNAGNFFDQFDEPTNARPERTLLGTAKDVGITALKGAINLPQAFVGLGDIATGGRVGKYLEEAGYRPEAAKQFLDEGLSPAQQYANQQVDNAQGFGGTLEALTDNPSAVATTVGESLPQMLGGAGIARGLLTAAPRMAPLVAGAVGEGAVAAGSSAEQIRNKTEDGLLTPEQQIAAAASGAGTAALGVAGGKIAQKLGIGDMDTALAGGLADTRRNFFTRLAGQGITEGIFEEMPQSAQEQMWQNFALGKPLDEGVSEAAATGLAAGSLTGAGFEAGRTALGGFENRTQPSAVEDQLLDDGTGQPAQANDQGADQQPADLQNSSIYSDDPIAQAAQSAPKTQELHKSAEEIEGDLLAPDDIDTQIAALMGDFELLRNRRGLPAPGDVQTPDSVLSVTPGGVAAPQYAAEQIMRNDREAIGETPAAAALHPGYPGELQANPLDRMATSGEPASQAVNPDELKRVRQDAVAERAKNMRLSGILPEGFDDERLARDEYRNILEGLGNQLTPGGDISYTRDGQDRITGRTSSVNPDWFKNLPPEEKLSVVDTQDAIKKALAGQKLGVRQTRLVKRLLDEASGVRGAQAEHLKAQRQEAKRARFEALKSFWDEMPDTGNDPFGIHQENVAELFNEDNYEPEATYDDRSIAEMAAKAESMGADWRDVDKALDSGDSAQTIQALSQLIYGLRNEHRPTTRTAPNSAAPGAAQAGDVQPGSGETPVESMAGESADVAQPAETGRAGEVAPTVKESLTAESIDSVANEAATSPTNDLPEPTESQKEAGNYKKAHVRLHGLDIAIENPKGSMRRGTDKSGKAWESEMQAHYGYVKRTTGADGDQVDVFIGDNPDSDKVFVIDQYHPDGTFDEHKVVMGAGSMLEAKSLYKRNYQKGWKVGPTTAMSMDEFKGWLRDGDTTKPLSAPGNLPVKPREESSISIPPQPNSGAASSDNLVRGEKSASKEQRNDPAADALSKEGNSQKNIPPESAKPKSKKSLGQQRSEKILGAAIGDKVIPSADTGYLTGGTTYEIQRISKSGEVDFKNVKTGGGASLSLGEMNNAERAGVVFEVVRGEKPKSGHRKTESAEAPKDYGGSLFDDPQYSLADSVGEQQVGEIIARIQSSFGAKLKITAVASAVELPPEVQAHMEKNGIAGNKVKGVFHGGSIFVNREALQTAQDVETVILHELAHVGLAKMFGPDIQAAMGSLYLAMGGDKTLRELATKYAMPLEKYQAAYASAKPAERLGFMTEELLAHIAENNKPSVKRFIKELIGAIRSWLRSKGFLSSAELSESELFALLKEVRQFAAADGGGIRYSLRDRPFSAARSIRNKLLAERNRTQFSRYSQLGRGRVDIAQTVTDVSALLGFDVPFNLGMTADMPSTTPMRFNLDNGVIEVNSRLKLPRDEAAQYLMEEVLHGIDVLGPSRTISASSRLLDEDGAVYREAADHFLKGGPLAEFLAYPLDTDRFGMYSGDRIKAELFARLGVIYLGEPALLKEALPNAYDAYHRIFGLERESPVSDTHVFRKVWKPASGQRAEVLRRYRPGSGPGLDAYAASTRGASSRGLGGLRRAIGGALHGSAFGKRASLKDKDLNVLNSPRYRLTDTQQPQPSAGVSVSETSSTDNLLESLKEKPFMERVRTSMRRQFTSAGLLGTDIHNLKIQADGVRAEGELQTKITNAALEDAIYKVFDGKRHEDLRPETKKRLNDILRGNQERRRGVPTPILDALDAMRADIQRLTRTHVDQLLDEVSDLVKSNDALAKRVEKLRKGDIRDDAFKERGGEAWVAMMEDGHELAAQKMRTISVMSGNFDVYLNRSYRAFDDPKWPSKVAKLEGGKIVRDAVNYIAAGMAEGGSITAQHLEAAAQRVNEILHEGTAFENLGAFVSQSKVGQKDLSMFIKRKVIAPEILALLGEYEDAPMNYTKSVTKMVNLVANHAFLNSFRDVGLELGLISEPHKKPLHHKTKIAGDAASGYEPLNGYYTTPELMQGLKDHLADAKEPNWLKYIIWINGMVKTAKTVLAPTTGFRNIWSSLMMLTGDAGFSAKGFWQGYKSAQVYFADRGSEESVAYVKNLRRLGVIYDSANYGEIQEMMAKAREIDNPLLNNRVSRAAGTLFDIAQKFYGFGDDFFKIARFEFKKAQLIKHKGLGVAEAEKQAAERIRNCTPTYSLVPRFVKTMRRVPIGGSFVSFPAEMVRNTYHLARYAYRDGKELGFTHPMVMREMLGLALNAGLMNAVAAALFALIPGGDDDKELLKLTAPKWNKNGLIFYFGRDESGQIRSMDASWLDAYSYLKKPFYAMMNGDSFGDAMGGALLEIIKPFFAPGVMAQALIESWTNKKESGGEIRNESSSALRQFMDTAKHLGKALGPGAFQNLNNFQLAMSDTITRGGKRYTVQDELAALVGFRISTTDPLFALNYRLLEYKDTQRDAAKILTSVASDPNKVDDDELREAYDDSMRAREKAYKEMQTVVRAAKKSGVSTLAAISVMRQAGANAEEARALAYDKPMPKWRPSKQMLAADIKRAGMLLSKDIERELKDRKRKLERISRETLPTR